jgi:hypothetical protein
MPARSEREPRPEQGASGSRPATRPAQYRLRVWAHESVAREAAETGATKTEVVLEALEVCERKRLEAEP